MAKAVSKTVTDIKTVILKIVAAVLLINFFVFGLAGLSLYQSRLQYESRVSIQTHNLSQSVSLTIASLFNTTCVALFSVEKEMERQLQNGAIDRQTIDRYIHEHERQVAELDGLRVANASGEFSYGDRVLSGLPTSIADREYFQYARNNPNAGLIISKPLLARSSGKWVINLVRRISMPDGSFGGVVIGAISLDYFTRLFSSFDLGKNGVLTLRDRDLAVVVRYPEPLGIKSSIGNKKVSKGLRELTQAGKTNGTYRNPGSIDPIERIFSFHQISNYPFYITVGLASMDYLSTWRTEAKRMMAIACFFSLGTLLSAWFIYGSIRRKLAAENELLQYRDHLEETVHQRTMDLESKNAQLAEEITLRRQADAELRKASIIMDRMSDAVMWISSDGSYQYVNDAACRIHGYTREEMLGMNVSQIAVHFPPEAWQSHWQELKQDGSLTLETVNVRRGGERFPVDVTANYLCIDGNEYNCTLVRDISDRKEAEAEKQNLLLQLGQSQKMESIGRLAGGIAHDFNNLLMPILGYAEMLRNGLQPEHSDYAKADNIIQAANKAQALTQQLLGFSRKQVLNMKTVDMNTVIKGFYEIMRRTVRESIDIQLNLAKNIFGIHADQNQLEQIILNLVINAQDAIPDKGVITIETQLVILDHEYVRQHPGASAGANLMLAVSDTGRGMDQEIIDNIFEPFFTTKEIGKGSGLGLATAYGIVKQHGGSIWVYSEVGRGTVFKLYFPVVDGVPIAETPDIPEILGSVKKDLTILLVEDNEMVRNLVCDLLQSFGCKVVVAERPKEALSISHGQKVDLLVTDVVMPDMNGRELHRMLLEQYPGLKVLFMSGYTNNVIVNQGVLEQGMDFIQKPFTANELATKLEALVV